MKIQISKLCWKMFEVVVSKREICVLISKHLSIFDPLNFSVSDPHSDAPKDVRVEPKPGENVKENESFSLTCTAHSNPLITQFKWIRRNNSKNDITVSTEKTFTVHSSKPSDSGLYICEVQNVIGSGKSQVKINIKCEYKTKHECIF